jgi:DNA-binding transcriptional ArsR family regulator
MQAKRDRMKEGPFADGRRLRILKKLTMGSYTLQEVADDFGVVKSTMNHHFVILRSAGLVRLRTSDNKYSSRHEVMHKIYELLDPYLIKN